MSLQALSIELTATFHSQRLLTVSPAEPQRKQDLDLHKLFKSPNPPRCLAGRLFWSVSITLVLNISSADVSTMQWTWRITSCETVDTQLVTTIWSVYRIQGVWKLTVNYSNLRFRSSWRILQKTEVHHSSQPFTIWWRFVSLMPIAQNLATDWSDRDRPFIGLLLGIVQEILSSCLTQVMDVSCILTKQDEICLWHLRSPSSWSRWR